MLSLEQVDKLATVCARRFHLTLDEACNLVETAQALYKEKEDAKFAVGHLTEQLAIANQERLTVCHCDKCECDRMNAQSALDNIIE